MLPEISNSADFGLSWPTWIAAGGFGLFCLLGFYATLLLVAGKHLPVYVRLLQLPSLRGRMLLGFVLAGTLPAISLALVLSERTTNERLETTSMILKSQAKSFTGLADFFLQSYVTDLTEAAQAIQPQLVESGSTIDTSMTQALQMMNGISLMMVLDKSGQVIASTGKTGDKFDNSSDPAQLSLLVDYASQPLRTGVPYISNGVTDPGHSDTISAVISVPVVDTTGSVVGTVMGLYNLTGLSRVQSPLAESNGIRSVVVDRVGQVMFASDNSGFSMRDNLTSQSMLNGPEYAPGQIFNFSQQSESAGPSDRYLATSYRMKIGWRLFLYRPLEEIEAALLDEYAVALAWLAGALLISICLALTLVRSLSGPLESLDASVRNFDLSLSQDPPAPPADAPREVLAIFEHLGLLDKRLRATYQKLRNSLQQGEKLRSELINVVENREKEIEKRTEELREANATLERLSREDSLTGLANRRWFADFLERAWQGALRDKTPLSILIIDIDNFKAYNDNYGHQKGDTCLKLVAEAICRAVGRASDLVSRYGGEEFVVILGDTPLEGGLKIAEKIRATVERLGVPHKGAPLHQCVTVSIGVTSTLPTGDTQPETVLVAADRAMYNAKHDGKNKVAYSTAARTGTYQALCAPSNTGTRLS